MYFSALYPMVFLFYILLARACAHMFPHFLSYRVSHFAGERLPPYSYSAFFPAAMLPTQHLIFILKIKEEQSWVLFFPHPFDNLTIQWTIDFQNKQIN